MVVDCSWNGAWYWYWISAGCVEERKERKKEGMNIW